MSIFPFTSGPKKTSKRVPATPVMPPIRSNVGVSPFPLERARCLRERCPRRVMRHPSQSGEDDLLLVARPVLLPAENGCPPVSLLRHELVVDGQGPPDHLGQA